MPRYRLPNNRLSISVDGLLRSAAQDGTFNPDAGSRFEDVLLREGAQQQESPFSATQAVAVQALASGAWMPTPGGQIVVAIGDSLKANGLGNFGAGFSTVVQSALNWGCTLLKQALWLPVGATTAWSSGVPDLVNYSLAVSGTTTQQAIDSQVGPASLLKAHWWSVQSGTNDLTLRAADTPAQICNRLRAICQAGLAVGVKIALWTIVPRSDAAWSALNAAITGAGSTIARQKLKQMAVNAWIRRYAQETPGVVLIDPYNELVDPASAAGDWLPGYSSDGTHWNGAGAFVAGQVFAAAMRPFLKPVVHTTISQLDVYNGADNVAGDFALARGMQGSGGTLGAGVTGTAPTGWNVDPQAGSFTAVAAAQARTDMLASGIPANGRELQIAVSTAAAGSQLRAYQAPTGAVIPAGVPFYCEAEISVSANTAAWQGPSLQMFFNSGSPSVNSQAMASDGSSLPLGATFDAVLRTPVMRSTGAAGGMAFMQMNLSASSAATMKIRRIGFRALDPAMPGLIMGAA